MIGSLLVVVTLCYFFTKISRVILFWAAFILTRPFGATIGDFLTKEKGGLNLGTMNSSLVLVAVMLVVLAFTVWKRNLHSDGNMGQLMESA